MFAIRVSTFEDGTKISKFEHKTYGTECVVSKVFNRTAYIMRFAYDLEYEDTVDVLNFNTFRVEKMFTGHEKKDYVKDIKLLEPKNINIAKEQDSFEDVVVFYNTRGYSSSSEIRVLIFRNNASSEDLVVLSSTLIHDYGHPMIVIGDRYIISGYFEDRKNGFHGFHVLDIMNNFEIIGKVSGLSIGNSARYYRYSRVFLVKVSTNELIVFLSESGNAFLVKMNISLNLKTELDLLGEKDEEERKAYMIYNSEDFFGAGWKDNCVSLKLLNLEMGQIPKIFFLL